MFSSWYHHGILYYLSAPFEVSQYKETSWNSKKRRKKKDKFVCTDFTLDNWEVYI